jgi:FkbM family methyltransferase
MNDVNSYPKISIITPNYNGGEFLEQTILSVLNQRYPNIEYIIIDGNSSDNSLEIIKKYESYLAYWISEKDNNMYEAIQKGFEQSTGEIMAWINSDDMYHSNAFFKVAEIFSSYPEVKWLTGANTNFDEKNRTVNTRHSYNHNKYSQFLNPEKHIQQESTFWRRNLWMEAGSKVDASLKYAGDFELWLRFNKYAQLYTVDTLIGGFRFRNNQITKLFMDKYTQECMSCLEKAKNSFSIYEKKVLGELINLKNKIEFSPLTSYEKKLIENKMEILSKQNDKIFFNINIQKFEIKGQKMQSVIKPKRNTMLDFLELLKFDLEYYPEVILDVGVANGTYELYETFPQSEFILFEPVEEFLTVLNNIKQTYDSVYIETCALGKTNDIISINVHPDLVGSSIYLEDEDSNVNGIPRSVEMKTLNSFINKYDLKNKSILLKIDVQGAEIDVLNGANELLEYIDFIVLESSLFDFFGNGIILSDIIKYMDERGFVVYDIFNLLNRPIDNALAQVDIAFVKKDSIFRKNQKFATSEQREQLTKTLTNAASFNASLNKLTADDQKFLNKLNSLVEKVSELENIQAEYIIYGHSNIGKTINALMNEKIIAFVDQKSDVISKEIKKGEVYNPKNLVNMKFDKIIITVIGREEPIIKYLTEELNINVNKIITLEI